MSDDPMPGDENVLNYASPGAGQQVPAMLAQRCAVLVGQGRHVHPGRADSERERLPPLLE